MSRITNNNRIAKNTLFLYIRMFVILIVSLYTSRIILNVLGESDYGIYNIIGGVVVLFSFINGALTAATQRYLNFYNGKGDEEKTHSVFCMSMNIYIVLSIIFLVLAETVGLWFVDTQLNIPTKRMDAAMWIYQFTIVTFILSLLRIPYNSVFIAYERMDFYAYFSLLEVFLKLVIVYSLYVTNCDKLILYGALLMGVAFITNAAYRAYCRQQFSISNYHWFWEKSMFKELFNFSSWSLFGNAAGVLAQQGLNILVNIFYGVTLNAALGIANQVSSQVVQFFSNFQTAFNPQIVKYYAAEQIKEFFNLIFTTSKFSYYLMFVISLPLILEIHKILGIWLISVPKYTAIFCQMILIFYLLEALTGPLWMAIQATGKIKNYQILVSLINFITLPIVYVVLKLGFPVWSVWTVRIFINIVLIIARCIYLQSNINLPLGEFMSKVIIPIFLTTIIILPIPILCTIYIPGYWNNLIVTISVTIIISVIVIYSIGLAKNEQEKIKSMVLNKVKKHKLISKYASGDFNDSL